MPVSRTLSVALRGVDGALVEIEADLANGLPAFTIIGLPDAALGEANTLPQRHLRVQLLAQLGQEEAARAEATAALEAAQADGDVLRSRPSPRCFRAWRRDEAALA
jgi:hypothetical protein